MRKRLANCSFQTQALNFSVGTLIARKEQLRGHCYNNVQICIMIKCTWYLFYGYGVWEKLCFKEIDEQNNAGVGQANKG